MTVDITEVHHQDQYMEYTYLLFTYAEK